MLIPNMKDIEFIDLKYVDLIGKLRHLTFPISYWEKVKKYGAGFDSSSLKGFKKTEKSDLVLLVDNNRTFIDPFYSDKTLSVFGNIYYPDRKTRYERDPRLILKKAIELVKKELKLDRILFLPELEFYVFSQVELTNSDTAQGYKIICDETEQIASGGYHQSPPNDLYSDQRNILVKMFQKCGIEVKYHHHEGGALAQMEIETVFTEASKSADDIIIAKYIIKNYFHKIGKFATFMPKPLKNKSGSGMHFHHILEKDGKSIFLGKKDQISQIGMNYINGILSHLESLCAFTNPTTNSYKRLTGGFETPKSASIGLADRTSAIRIPGYAKDQMPIEFRVSDATCNPYLTLSAILLAGLDGIRKKSNYLKPGQVPTSLQSAIYGLKNDQKYLTLDNIFPQELVDFWVDIKTKEDREMQHTPHPLEYLHYLDM